MKPPGQPAFTRINESHTVGRSEGPEDDADNERPFDAAGYIQSGKDINRERPKSLAANRNSIRWLSRKLEVTNAETTMRLQANIDDVYNNLDDDKKENKAHCEDILRKAFDGMSARCLSATQQEVADNNVQIGEEMDDKILHARTAM